MRKIFFFSLMIFSLTAFAVPVTWTNLVNVTVNGNTLTGLTSSSWSAGAFSVESIAANTDGYFEMTAQETSQYRMGGLSSVDANASYTSIQYAVYFYGVSTLCIYESGSNRGSFGTYSIGDVFRVSRETSVVKYYKNSTLFYTSTITTTAKLYADTSLYSYGATIYNAQIVQVPEPASICLFLCFFLIAGKLLVRK